MTHLLGPDVRDPDVWAFEMEDLEPHGVTLDEAQQELLERGQWETVAALAVGFPLSPEQRRLQEPLFVIDDDGVQSIVTVPLVVTITPHLYDNALLNEGRLLTRFPSLVGRRLEPIYSREFGPDVTIHSPEGFRIWYLWPISDSQVEDVLESSSLWRRSNYELLEAWYAADRGDIDPCDIVIENESNPYDDHDHHEIMDSRGDVQIIQCADGDEWMERFRATHFSLDEDGLLVPRGQPDLRLCDPELQHIWERLRASSAMNSFRAIDAIPPADRPAVLRTERLYSPWLLSS